MRIKICGITKLEQAKAITELGISSLGFISVPESPRYISPTGIKEIINSLPLGVSSLGVFANCPLKTIIETVTYSHLTGVQLHGQESGEFCLQLRQELPQIEIIKAFRIQNRETLNTLEVYYPLVDTLLLDAYHPQVLGGSGQTINWQVLQAFSPPLPWLLAGGLTPENINIALSQVSPTGIDLSSGVENSPGDKDLLKVKRFLLRVRGVY